MKKLYKWSGLAVTSISPLVVFIACNNTEKPEKKDVSYYFNTPTIAETTATITFKELQTFVGKTLAVQLKKNVDTSSNWMSPIKNAITDANKGALNVSLSGLEAGKSYDMKVTILESVSSSTVVAELGVKNNAFTTASQTTDQTPPTTTPGTETPPTTTPENKALKIETEVISPTSAKINVLNADEYVGRTLILKYKENKKNEDLTIEDYFALTARAENSATLSFDGDYLDAFKGKKLKIDYKKHVSSTDLPTVDKTLARLSSSGETGESDGTGGDSETEGADGASGESEDTPSSPVEPANPAKTDTEWTSAISKTIEIPVDVKTKGLSIVLEELTTSGYDLKLTIVQSKGDEIEEIKEIGEKEVAFTPSSEAPATVKSRENQKELKVTNAQNVSFILEGLNEKANYSYSLLVQTVKKTDTNTTLVEDGLDVLIPYSDTNTFNTLDIAKITKSVVGNRVVLKAARLLEKYNNQTLTITLSKVPDTSSVSSGSTETVVARTLVENRSFSITFPDSLKANSTYKIQISLSENGKLINLQGIDTNSLSVSTPADSKVTITATAGPTSVVLNSDNATQYKGKNLVVKYAPMDAGTSEKTALESLFAKQVTATVAEDGKVELPLYNLERKNGEENFNSPREYVYKVTLEGTDLHVTASEYSKVSTTKFVNVKLNRDSDADNTITYAGSSSIVKITDLTPYKDKKLQIIAVPAGKNSDEFTANFFPTKEEDVALVKKSSLVSIAASDVEKEFKILDLDSAREYIFQVFVENEKNPLLSKGYLFQSNVSPKTVEELVEKNKVKVKVSKLANAINGKIKLEWAASLTDLNGSDTTKKYTLAEQTINESNKDSIEFTLESIVGQSLVYRILTQPQGETDFSEAKEVVLSLPMIEAEGIVGGIRVKLKNAKILAGSIVYLKYRKDSSASTDLTASLTAKAVVQADGTATLEEMNLVPGEIYFYEVHKQVTEEPTTDTGTGGGLTSDFAVVNVTTEEKVLTLSGPKAVVSYPTDKTQVKIKVESLYGLVGNTIRIKYRKSSATSATWTNLPTEKVVTDGNEKTGLEFTITGLEVAKYEFEVVDTTTGKTIIKTTSFQHEPAAPVTSG